MNTEPNIDLATKSYGEPYKILIDFYSESSDHPCIRNNGFTVPPLIQLDIYNLLWYNKSYDSKIIFDYVE